MWDFNIDSFWDALMWSLLLFFWIAYIFVWVRCLFDMFSDTSLGGFAKALWAICFIFFGPLTTLIYLIARGNSMNDRAMQQQANMRARQDQYIRSVAAETANPAEQIKNAKDLLDAGAISQQEFETLKAKALA